MGVNNKTQNLSDFWFFSCEWYFLKFIKSYIIKGRINNCEQRIASSAKPSCRTKVVIPVQILTDQDQVLVPRHQQQQQQEVKVDLLLRGVHAPDPNHIRHRRLLARGLFQPQTVKPKRNLKTALEDEK